MAARHDKIGKVDAKDAVMEPCEGGRWYERGEDGSTCDWGRVLVWEPHSRLVLSWDISADWQPDPHLNTEVEVRFIPLDKERTRVELEHRRLSRFGARRDEMRGIFDSEGGGGRPPRVLRLGGREGLNWEPLTTAESRLD